MLYAKVVVDLAVSGPFDYIVPDLLKKKIAVGTRAWIPFGNKKIIGYVVGLAHKSQIKNLKKIFEIIDDFPVLNKNMLKVTRELSDYYCCYWGQAIATALPGALRKGKKVELEKESVSAFKNNAPEYLLLHDFAGRERFAFYREKIADTLKDGKSVIVIFPDIDSVLRNKEEIESIPGTSVSILYRNEPKELDTWAKIKNNKSNIVVGTRSGIFAPLANLGLIIIDEEEDSVYKQDQVPHYHARKVALERGKIEKAGLILGSTAPSLESFYLAKKQRLKIIPLLRKKNYPEVKIIDMKSEYQAKNKDYFFSKYLTDAISLNLSSGRKTLLFINRSGFATHAACLACAKPLRCPRCNTNLVYHFKDDVLSCHYCNFKMPPPKICPVCNAGYIKYSGLGTEKIESELSRIFPQAKIRRLESRQRAEAIDAEILVSTSSVIRHAGYNFNLIGVLGVDNSLNRVDLYAAEKTFAALSGLTTLTDGKIVIQTKLPLHHCFQALLKNNADIFYEEELKQRKQLEFPPYKHMALVKLRSGDDEKARKASSALFGELKKQNKDKEIEVVSVNRAEPHKLRGNFYWQVLLIGRDALKISGFLKINLKNFRHSGIIVTVDVDPV